MGADTLAAEALERRMHKTFWYVVHGQLATISIPRIEQEGAAINRDAALLRNHAEKAGGLSPR